MIVRCCAVTATGSAGNDGCKSDDPLRICNAGLRAGDAEDALFVMSTIGPSVGDEGCNSVEFFLGLNPLDDFLTSTTCGNGKALAICACPIVSVGGGEEGCNSVEALILCVNLVGVGDRRSSLVVSMGVASTSAASNLEMRESIESRRGGKRGSYSKFSSRLRLGFQLGLRFKVR